jgi:hypothetical protein
MGITLLFTLNAKQASRRSKCIGASAVRRAGRAPEACADFRPQRSTCICDTPYRSHDAFSFANERTCMQDATD